MADIGNDVFFATIPELNARLKSKEFSAQELARAFAGRLAQLGPSYNALALPLPQQALRKAREVDQDIKRERLRGPLQGIPYGVKDLLSLAGQPTTWGAKPYAGQVFDYNATVIDKLAGVGPHALVGRIFERAGGGRGRRADPVRHRIGDVGIYRDAGILLRRDGVAAHLRAGQPVRRHGAFLDPR